MNYFSKQRLPTRERENAGKDRFLFRIQKLNNGFFSRNYRVNTI